MVIRILHGSCKTIKVFQHLCSAYTLDISVPFDPFFFSTSDFESLRESDEQIVTSSNKDTGDASVTREQEEDVFAQVDKLLEGPDKDKEKAYEILQRNRNKVC